MLTQSLYQLFLKIMSLDQITDSNSCETSIIEKHLCINIALNSYLLLIQQISMQPQDTKNESNKQNGSLSYMFCKSEKKKTLTCSFKLGRDTFTIISRLWMCMCVGVVLPTLFAGISSCYIDKQKNNKQRKKNSLRWKQVSAWLIGLPTSFRMLIAFSVSSFSCPSSKWGTQPF